MAETPSAPPRSATAGQLACGGCGRESRQPPFRPPVPEQAPDLDLRPGEPVRSTMTRWLQQCPHCHYAAPAIAKAHPGVAAAVTAAPFRALIQDAGHPALARRFLAWGHVLEETGALHAAAEATLQAAWVADDAARPDLARAWRQEAVALWRSGPPLDAEQTVRVIDALRRSEAWEDAEATAAELAMLAPPEAVGHVIALERRLVAAKDAGRHTVASALPPPARRPHATHRRRDPNPGGLFGWLKRLFRKN